MRTAQRWMAAYKREGLTGLAPKRRSDRGRCRGLPEQLHRLIEGLALGKPRPPMAAMQRRAAGVAVRYGWPEPTYRQVRGVVGRMEKGTLRGCLVRAKAPSRVARA